MHTKNGLIALLRSHEGTSWEPRPPAALTEMLSVEKILGMTFPPEYRNFFLYSDGGEFSGAEAHIYFFPVNRLLKFNPDSIWSPRIPGMIIFGDDSGDYIYYFDPENRLNRGSWSIYLVEKGAVSFDHSIYAANTIEQLCRRIINGDNIINEAYIK